MYRTTVLDHNSVCQSDAAVSLTAFTKIMRDGAPDVEAATPDELAVSWRVAECETQAACLIRIPLRAYENATDLRSKVYSQEAQIASLQLQVAELIADASKQAVGHGAAFVRGRADFTFRDHGWSILPNVSDPHAIEILQSSARMVVGVRATCTPLLPDSCLREYLDPRADPSQRVHSVSDTDQQLNANSNSGSGAQPQKYLEANRVSVSRGETALHYYIGLLDHKWTVENEHVFTAIVAELLRLGVDPAAPDNRGDTALAWLDRAELALRARLTGAAEDRAATFTIARIRKLLRDAVTCAPWRGSVPQGGRSQAGA
jgi:hypothetical protein